MWSSPSCWPSSSSSSSTGSCAAQRSSSSNRMPSTPSSRGRRSEVTRLTFSCPVCPHRQTVDPCVLSQLQAPSVKGFDFAKLHLGQHSKDDIMVIQEPGPLPAPVKEATPSDGGDLNTPKSKGSSTKVARSSRRRGRSDTYIWIYTMYICKNICLNKKNPEMSLYKSVQNCLCIPKVSKNNFIL